MAQTMIKKDDKYCHFIQYFEHCPLLNIAFYLIDKKIIKKQEDIQFIESFSQYFSEDGFYKLEFLTYYVSHKKDIHAHSKKEFDLNYIQSSFIKLLKIKEEFKELVQILKPHSDDIKCITHLQFKEYFHYDQYKISYINLTYGSIYNYSEKDKKLVYQDFDNALIVNDSEIKIRNQFLTKVIKAWFDILNPNGTPIHVEAVDEMDLYGSDDVYALFLSRGSKKGFYSQKDSAIVDIKNAKTFASLGEAKKFVAIKKLTNLAYVKVHMQFLSIEETLGSVNTSSLEYVNSIQEKDKFETIKTKTQLAKELLSLCNENDHEIRQVLEKMLSQEEHKQISKKIKI